MKLSEKQKNDFVESLKKLGYMTEGENLIEYTTGDYWEFKVTQVRGNYLFTEKNMVFVGGFMGNKNWCIPYDKITEVKKCNVGGLLPFMPTGIKVTYTDENGKTKKKICSVMKRNDWIDFINNRK